MVKHLASFDEAIQGFEVEELPSDDEKDTGRNFTKEPRHRIPWIVSDRDQVTDFDKINQLAEKSGVGAGWSNSCFEIWMYAYFGEMPAICESYICGDRFADKFEEVTGQKY